MRIQSLRWPFYCIALHIALCCSCLGQLRVTVDGGDPDPSNRDGSTWGKALSASDLADALGPVVLYGQPKGNNEYWLKAGAYPGLTLHKGTKILGGFEGIENTSTERNPTLNPTFLGTVVISKYFVYPTPDGGSVPEFPDAVAVDGCTIMADSTALILGGGPDYPTDQGTPLISNCTIASNGHGLATVQVGTGPFQLFRCDIFGSPGAGIELSSSPTFLAVQHCVIHDNGQAGVFVQAGPQLTMTDTVIAHNGISGNPAGSYGYGGVFFHDRSDIVSSATIQRCIITNNIGGGIYAGRPGTASPDATISISDSTVANNFSPYAGGGGIGINNFGRPNPNDVTIYNCLIQNNSTTSDSPPYADGGGLWLQGTSVRVVRCQIIGNSAQHYGGGIFQAATDTESPNTRPLIQDCLIANNVSTNRGGGIYLELTDAQVINCTIVNNVSTNDGGGIYVEANRSFYTSPLPPQSQQRASEIWNCAFAGNAGATGNALCFNTDAYSGDPSSGPRGPGITNCAYVTGQSFYRDDPLHGDFTLMTLPPDDFEITDPGFKDAGNGDFRLTNTSPLLDRGFTGVADDLDLDALPRVAGSAVDIGAYEFQAATPQISIQLLSGGHVRVTFEGRLQTTTSLTPVNWQDVPGVTGQIDVDPTPTQQFWRAVF